MNLTKTVGNERVRSILLDYITSAKNTGNVPVPFLLFLGPSGLGKMDVAREAAGILLGEYLHQDSIFLEDMSKILEKQHTIKISSDDEITRPDGSIYVDLGIREVHQWMTKSPLGGRKALVIEDIERMTESAINALLKILEEPLPGRIIIATTSQVGQVLPTVLSRALLFSFYPTDEEAIELYIQQNPGLAQYNREFLYAVAAGRPAVLGELLQTEGHLELLEKAFLVFAKYVKPQEKREYTMTDMYSFVVPLVKAGIEKIFLQAYIYFAAKNLAWEVVRITQDTYVLCDYNINTEHVFFDFVSRLYVASLS